MLGNNVEVQLCAPGQTIAGELRKQNAEGVWVYFGWAEQAALRFYPQHRIVEMLPRLFQLLRFHDTPRCGPAQTDHT